MSNSKLQEAIELVVHFDLDQISSQLQYRITDADGDTFFNTSGKYAGTYLFKLGQKIALRVVGHRDQGEVGFQVLEAVITAEPIMDAGSDRTQWLSPFQPDRASISFNWLDGGTAQPDTDNPRRASVASAPLSIQAPRGHWELSLSLSVCPQVPVPLALAKLLRFDPEVVVISPGGE